MDTMYTKDGAPLNISRENVFGRSGRHAARIKGKRAYGPDGRYVATIVGIRLICRSPDSATISSPFTQSSRAGRAMASRVGAAGWGEEPTF